MKDKKRFSVSARDMVAATLFIVVGGWLTLEATSVHIKREDRIIRAANATPQDFSRMMAPSPNPNLNSEEVVKLLWSRLRENDLPAENSGIQAVWNFMSPHARQVNSSYTKFSERLKTGDLAPLLKNDEAKFALLKVKGNTAIQFLVIPDDEGSSATHYMMLLSRQNSGEYADCWLAEGFFEIPENLMEVAQYEYPTSPEAIALASASKR